MIRNDELKASATARVPECSITSNLTEQVPQMRFRSHVVTDLETKRKAQAQGSRSGVDRQHRDIYLTH